METALLTLDTLAQYLRAREVELQIEQNETGEHRFIRMGWRFDMGDAAVLISVNDGSSDTTRLEITCVTQKQYAERAQEVLKLLNDRNRERAFSRSMDSDGNIFLEYVGFYPTLCEFPQETFDVLFGGVLTHFQDDYAALEGFQLNDSQTPQA